jgi:hypothetical protein
MALSACIAGVPVPVPPPSQLQGELALRPLARDVPWRCSVWENGSCTYVRTCDHCEYLPVGTPAIVRSQRIESAVSYANIEAVACNGERISWTEVLDDGYLGPRTADSASKWAGLCDRAKSWRAHVLDYGLYKPDVEAAPSSGTVVVRSKELLSQSLSIQVGLGASMGFRYFIDGPENSAVLTVRATHPPLTNPATGRTTVVDQWAQPVTVRRMYWNTGWTFQQPWELVPGTWTIDLFRGTEKLQSLSFEVTLAH